MLSYAERNKDYITSSKLKAFEKCPLAYKFKYVDLIPEPNEEVKDHFLIGQAFDDLMTEGQEWFDKHYVVVSTRCSQEDIEANIDKYEYKLLKAKTIGTVEKYKGQIKKYKNMVGKIQLTKKMKELIDAMEYEFRSQKLFNQNPKKHEFIWEIAGRKVKAELDDMVKISDTHYEIRDIKTCANVARIDPLNYYLTQATVYWMALYESLEADWNDIEIDVIYEFVDKNIPSRSRCIKFSNHNLINHRGHVLKLIEELIFAEETGIFFPTNHQNIMWDSPYYGYQYDPDQEGYGRVTKIEII